jgi:PAS domain S-box-containing protein
MSTSPASLDRRLEGVPIQEILEGFARLHDFVVVADIDGRVLWLSDAFREICASSERAVGRRLDELFPRLPEAKPLAGRLRDYECVRDVRLELEGRRGEALTVDVSAFSVASGDGGEPLVVAIVRPVAERQRADQHRADGLLTSLFEAAPDAVIALDASSFITWANPAVEAIFGAPPAELVGRPLALFLPHATGFGRIALALHPEGEVTAEEVELRRRDGRPVWVSISSRLLRNSRGESEGSVAFVRDVTKLRRARARLERKNAELEGYVHSVSHDLRSPLVSLLGFSRLLRQDYEGLLNETGRHFLDRIEQAGRTMEALLNDLLELSRIEDPGERRVWVDPRAVLLQLQAELKPRLDEKHVHLLVPESPSLVLCDRTRLYQVFSNLIGNALDHMGPCEDPRIVVDVRETPDGHLLSVADNGRGVEPAQHERIFEVFQTARPRPDGGRSTGMGLAIVKKIAETHGGRVWVESEPGRGAVFHVNLPRR